ncbi:MAG TPA: DNA repair protein RecN [Anaerolineales bacterium]|nr:DNA repair protein RecN [Anaerolineales bacterium]
MLHELLVRNFAIIEELRLAFEPGLIIFTGETGAGKSIIVDAVEMLLGGRADSTAVRSGADLALIEGVFQVEPPLREALESILEREDLAGDRETLTLGREIRREGRSTGRVNGRAVNLSLLRELGELLVDVHGQSEHLSLLRVREHIHLLDRYAVVDGLRMEFGDLYQRLAQVRRELADMRQNERDKVRRAEMLSFQMHEIEAAQLQQGEDQALLEERTRLANAEQLAGLAEQALAALDERVDEVPPATDRLGQAAHVLGALAKIDRTMEEAWTESQALEEQAGDLGRRLRVYREAMEFNPHRLDQVEERLSLIRSLQRKYGESTPEVLRYAEAARAELETITHAEERIHALEAEEADLLGRVGAAGQRLSDERRRAGEGLSSAIEAELGDLQMQGARFAVDMAWEDDPQGAPTGERRVAFSALGLDRVEFLVGPNPGEGLKPLARIASGGETSRLMLGLKGVLAHADRTPTLIFDEIDQGIGGRVAAVVGQKLWNLARSHQVVCITHLPQLAAFGDQHIKVEKLIESGRTTTSAQSLDEPHRIPELAQMLGSLGEPGIQSAADLLRQAAEAKSQQAER